MNETDDPSQDVPEEADSTRRDFLLTTSTVAMTGGLVAGYGMLAVMAGRFLYPSGKRRTAWQLVGAVDRIPVGDSIVYTTPTGSSVVIARQDDGTTEKSFIALSGVCPHLGCQVFWEPHNDRFFCPCHNGVFNAKGEPMSGPPEAGNTPLSKFDLRVEAGLLFIEVSLDAVTRVAGRTPDGDGRRIAAHDTRSRTKEA